MKNLYLIAYLDLKESLRAKWFLVYSLVFGGLIALIVILPIFILITTVRSISGDRDNHILEYMLSFPISLRQYYWGKIIGRFVTVYMPVFFAMVMV